MSSNWSRSSKQAGSCLVLSFDKLTVAEVSESLRDQVA